MLWVARHKGIKKNLNFNESLVKKVGPQSVCCVCLRLYVLLFAMFTMILDILEKRQFIVIVTEPEARQPKASILET